MFDYFFGIIKHQITIKDYYNPIYLNVAYHLELFLSTPGSLILTSGAKTGKSQIIFHPALFVPNGQKLPR